MIKVIVLWCNDQFSIFVALSLKFAVGLVCDVFLTAKRLQVQSLAGALSVVSFPVLAVSALVLSRFSSFLIQFQIMQGGSCEWLLVTACNTAFTS